MKNILIAGGSGGIGSAIYNQLKKDFNIYTISRNGDIKCDFNDLKSLQEAINNLKKEISIDIFIYSAGVGVFKPHEELNLNIIEHLININLKAPILITNLLLRDLKKNKGHIINISSIEALRFSKFSALYSATKGGIRSFFLSLFEEVRKFDLKITNINPDITKTNFFENLQFEPSSDPSSYIDPIEIAKAVEFAITTNSVVEEITIRPQRVKIEKKRRI